MIARKVPLHEAFDYWRRVQQIQPDDGTIDADSQPEEQDLLAALLARAIIMFLRAGKDPIESNKQRIASEITNGLVVAVRAVIRDVCRRLRY